MGTEVLSQRWLQEREVDQSNPSSIDIKKEWSYTSTFPCSFMALTGTLHLFYRLSLYVPYWGILRELVFMFSSQNFLFVLLQYGLYLSLHIFCIMFQLLKRLRCCDALSDDDIFVNWNWVATRWQLFSTHIHTNNTGNVTKQTIQRTQK